MKNKRKFYRHDSERVSNYDVSLNVEYLGNIKMYFYDKQNYALLLYYFPFSEKKEKTYFNLKLKDRPGFLSRHLIRVSHKYGIYKTFIKEFVSVKSTFNYWNNQKKPKSSYTMELSDDYKLNYNTMNDLLFKMLFEERARRLDISYVRKRKLEKLKI